MPSKKPSFRPDRDSFRKSLPEAELSKGDRTALNRRRFIESLSALGLGSTLLPGALAEAAQESQEITAAMVSAAAKIAGLSLDKEASGVIAKSLNQKDGLLKNYQELREMKLGNEAPSAVVFNPVLPGMKLPGGRKTFKMSKVRYAEPKTEEDLAFLPLTELSRLIKRQEIKSVNLTKLYLGRLKKYDPLLHCVVTLTEELALKQAVRADEELAAGKYRGPLHGIPWGAKDLLAVKGYKTTFGASPYKAQVIDADSSVYKMLTEAGAVLVAKLTLGALAMGDRWFGGLTRSPWDPGNEKQGSSGSSAGPASATAAGLVGFSIGTETLGSIMSPSSRCGVTGLRPTFGRVSRSGAMALSWTMDKIGPICRTAEDCALVLKAICGPDGSDNTLIDIPFNWDGTAEAQKLRVAYLRSLFEREIKDDPENPQRAERQREQRKFDEEALRVIRSMGIDPKPIDLPEFPSGPIGFVLTTEGAAAFDDIIRDGRIDSLSAEPERSSWPNSFRLHRFVPAVEYIQANRARYRLMEEFAQVFADIDLFMGSSLSVSNLTGNPEISLPHGFDSHGQPTSLRFTGKLFGEKEILLLAHAFQQKTEHHKQRPKL